MAKKRKLGISIFIACEGSNTEPLYFERLKEIMEDEDIYPYAKSVNIIVEKFHQNEAYLSNYAKSGDYNVYPYIEGKTKEAFSNASWLRNMLSSANQNYTVYEVNPYTDVDFLVKKLLLDDCVYEFRFLGQYVIFKGVEFVANKANDEYIVKITNSTNRSLVMNEFEFYNCGMAKIELANSVILAGNITEINLGQLQAYPKIFIRFQNLKLEVSGVLP